MAGAKKGSGTAKTLIGFALAGLVATGAAAFAYASTFVPVVSPGSTAGGLDLSGKTVGQASKSIEAWWGAHESKPLQLWHDGKPFGGREFTMKELGVSLDLPRTLKLLPVDDPWEAVSRRAGISQPKPATIAPALTIDQRKLKVLQEIVADELGNRRAPTVRLVGSVFVRTPEKPGMALDEKAMLDQLALALLGGAKAVIPLRAAEAKVSSSALKQIEHVVASYSTRYSEGNRPRSRNIRTAAARIDGTVLLPGDKFSFNGHLGRRSLASGFHVAGVYQGGRHAEDVGGGICQVSTTLFNAVLLSGLKIVDRSPHSLPVPYVPMGRDAAVSFPAPDFAFENVSETPLAISASAAKGQITFRVLGRKVEGREVRISQRTTGSWSRGVKYVNDSSIPPGTERLEDRGGSGFRASTTRQVLVNGKTVLDETFPSIYSGGPRIVRINRSAPRPKATGPVRTPPAVTPPATRPSTPPTTADGL